MSVNRAELRTALYAMAEVSWEDQNGTSHDETARFEDRSVSGACLRVKTPISVGSKVKIKWRWEVFSGVAKYCRPDGVEYVLGIERNGKDHIQTPPVPIDPIRESAASIVHPPSTEKIQSGPKQQEGNSNEVATSPKPDTVPILRGAPAPGLVPQAVLDHGTDSQNNPRVSRPQEIDSPKGIDLQTQQLSSGKERTPMSTKWLDTALGRQKQDAPNGNATGVTVPGDRGHAESGPAGKVRAEAVVPDKMPANAGGKGVTKPHGDLQSMEDIYRSAGIMNPRMGYSVSKVVEMLNSDHIRGLSNDAKRAAVLMALDAAGISIEEVLRDAALRKDALSAYEAGQRKQFEEYWARKIEGNSQIQSEMDRVTAQYLERINRTLEEVAEEKSAFARWQTMKQREAEQISEAVGLCSKPSPSEPPREPVMAQSGAGPIVKTS
jgi:hypothetical protein